MRLIRSLPILINLGEKNTNKTEMAQILHMASPYLINLICYIMKIIKITNSTNRLKVVIRLQSGTGKK